MLSEIVSSLEILADVSVIPDGEASLPAGMSGKLDTIFGWVKGICYVILAMALAVAAVSMALEQQGRGNGMQSGSALFRIVVAAIVVGASGSIIGVLI